MNYSGVKTAPKPSELLQEGIRILGSGAQIAEKLGVSAAFVSQMRSGKKAIPAECAYSLAEMLGYCAEDAFLQAMVDKSTGLEHHRWSKSLSRFRSTAAALLIAFATLTGLLNEPRPALS